MSIIQERIRSLALPESDCVELSQQQLDEVLSSARPLLTGAYNNKVNEAFSIADLTAEEVTTKFRAFSVSDPTVFVLWPAFREGFKINWEVFTAHYDDFWYPSSDDVIVISPSLSWALEITHEETIRFFCLANANP